MNDRCASLEGKDSFERIGVVGAGQMGSGIAEVCALAAVDVLVCEPSAALVAEARRRIEASLERAVGKGRISDDICGEALDRLSYTQHLTELSDRDLVIEAVAEDPAIKLDVLSTIDEVVSPETILASNTSSLPIISLANATSRPEQVIGLHFFNPVPVMPLVEVVASLRTSEETSARTTGFAATALHKQVITGQDRAGFVVNALLIPYLLSAVRMLESGFASARDIDLGMRLGCAHPMGPLEVTDLIGLDTTMAIAQSMYDEFKEPLYAPPPLLQRMVQAGLTGRKSGRGFFEYVEHP
ncbi:3-hydroxybutyryl-CoA dehydrogenase [Streptomyces sp. NPDC008343]|uniref:3-hydroxybutyryl-CoA dehydrogenase n=1 Tax=Streptomyces sp. NPDC008343 TaxID=3364828 RepID=UPI0036E3B660